VCDLGALPPAEVDQLLAATEVGDVWGVGPRIGAQLRAGGVATALDLARLDPASVRRRWSVVLERTVRELQGLPCVDLDNAPGPKQQIAVTRSFGRPVRELPALVEAVSEFGARAAEKLRRQDSLASQVLVFIHTSPFRPGPRFAQSLVVPLRRPTADTARIVDAAVMGLKLMFQPGFDLAKAGVMLLELCDSGALQGELDLGDDEEGRDRGRLMQAMDAVNGRWGRATIHPASAGTAGDRRIWTMRQGRRTPHYTTDWRHVPVARA